MPPFEYWTSPVSDPHCMAILKPPFKNQAGLVTEQLWTIENQVCLQFECLLQIVSQFCLKKKCFAEKVNTIGIQLLALQLPEASTFRTLSLVTKW